MLLLAEAGSTKIQWATLQEGKVASEFVSAGVNPCLLSPGQLRDALGEALRETAGTSIDRVVYYGAGCLPEVCPAVADTLRNITGCREAEVYSDMLGAARALCGHNPGIAAILGTGANSCYFDGNEIKANTPPLGFILGDEGSGARLGIALVNGVLKGYFPAHIADLFAAETGLDKAGIIRRVYRQAAPNAFLASLTRFIGRHISEPALEEMVVREFMAFFERNVLYAYPSELPVHFTGSIAAAFERQLREAADAVALYIGRIEARPMPLLIRYHLSES